MKGFYNEFLKLTFKTFGDVPFTINEWNFTALDTSLLPLPSLPLPSPSSCPSPPPPLPLSSTFPLLPLPPFFDNEILIIKFLNSKLAEMRKWEWEKKIVFSFFSISVISYYFMKILNWLELDFRMVWNKKMEGIIFIINCLIQWHELATMKIGTGSGYV